VRLTPTSADSRFVLGLLLETQGRVAEARQAYEETLRLAPRHPMARSRMAGLGGVMGASGPERGAP